MIFVSIELPLVISIILKIKRTVMDDSAVFAVRAKYAEDLEELVQCPVCFERPRRQVFTCVQGHHVCKSCRDMLAECPVCKSRFSSAGTRNFVVEQLCTKLDEIIASLLEPVQSNPIAVPSTAARAPTTIGKSISTQTDHLNTPALVDESVMIIDDNTMSACRIGFCRSQLPADCMYHHVVDYHNANLVEASYCDSDDSDGEDGEEIYKDFKLKYDLEKLYDFAINSKEFGLFFFNVHIDKEGDLYFTIQTTNPSQDNRFLYELSVTINHAKYSIEYDGLIPTNLSGQKYLRARKCKRSFFKSFFKHDKLNETDKRAFLLSLTIVRN